ncbi:MAG: 2-oxoglutarate and iron-dependent oxygenase domain-containing protein [Actinomycetota bacterium]
MGVPVIDVAGLFSSDESNRRATANEIGEACENVGFLTVVGHGVDADLCAAVLHETRRLFTISDAEKAAAAWNDERPNRGYDPAGRQRLDADAAADLKEAWSLGPEHLVGSSPMQQANVWPSLDGFKPVVAAYHAAAMSLCERLMRAMALSLDLDEDYFEPFHQAPVCTLRLLHYPPRPTDATAGQFGAGAHTDWGAVTVLLQDGEGSLEVQARDGSWIEVEPQPESFVINVGDLLAQWTNDRYTSTRHRVLGVAERERYSVACFYDLDHDAVIEVLPTCVSDDNPARYAPTTAGRHLQAKFDASMAAS